MHLSSILILFLIQFYFILCLWKKSKNTLDNYIIDILFTNSLTIIRCNPYESHIFREITIETIGHIKCSNKKLFLPNNHIEYITLLEWNSTLIICNKKNKIKEEKTFFFIKHKAKNAFKKIKFNLIRVGSIGLSDLKIDEKKFEISFKHPPKKFDTINKNQDNNYLITDIYSFKNRPIICRERQLLTDNICSNQHLNLSYVCYYRIGVTEPPTVADMEDELKLLSQQIDLNDESKVDLYINNAPKNSLFSKFPMIVIFIIIFIIIIVIIICCCCCCCQSNDDEHNYDNQIDSDTSNVSNISEN